MKVLLKALLISVVVLVSSIICHAAAPPANDNFTNRTDIVASASVSVQGRNASATTEAGEPTIDGETVYRSVWWSWTAPFSGPVTITTSGSSFDTLLGIFIGSTLAGLSSIAENDDYGGLYTSGVSFSATGGVPYVILVGGFNGASGKVKLNITTASAPCSYSLNPASRSVSSSPGTNSVAVTTTAGCTWSAVSNDSWLTITSGANGSGSGTVFYSIAINTALSSRTGTLTVAGLTHTVVQAAAPACTYSISPTSASFTSAPATNSFTMTAGTGCSWTATPNASWITIASGSSGTGNGTTTYVLATNSLSSQRINTITVAGLTHTITQAGSIPCTYSIAPSSAPFSASGGTSNIVVSTQTACPWTASSSVSWVTFSSTNGSGNGTVTYTVASNTDTISRSGTLLVAGNTFTVTQAANVCAYTLTPTFASVSSSASSGSIVVTAGNGCAWTAISNDSWLTITSGSSGSGGGTISYSVSANPDTSVRVGTLTAGGQTFTVTQAAAACTFSIIPTAAHYGDAGGSGSIAVTAGTGCAWTAVSNDGFITVDSGSPGSGNGTVAYTVSANATTSSRTGTITVAGSTFTITQDGTVLCTYGISPSSASYSSGGGSSTVAVTANTGCAWSVSSGASWLTFTPGSGTGNGTVTYTVAANTSSISRTGTLTIAGNIFTVTQSGAPCVFSISPTTATFTYTGGSGSVTVTATSGCVWTSSSDSSWLTATNGASGTGNGTLIYSVASTTSPSTRTGRLTIAGRIFTVTQTGAPCLPSISPVGASIPDSGDGGFIALTESDITCAWTVTNTFSWITISPSSGTGSATLNYTVAPTTQSTTRSGSVTIAGLTFTFTQDGDTTSPSVTLTSPSNGSTISNVVNLSATASDNIGITRVDFYRDSGTLLGSDITSPYVISYNTTNTANGSHSFYAAAIDTASNQAFSSTNSVTVTNSVAISTNQWAFHFGSTADDGGLSTATDSSANIILTGYFGGSIDFGGGSLTNAGSDDIFIAKFTPAGVHSWSARYGSTGKDRGNSIAVDSTDAVLVAGYFSGSVDFGGGTLTSAGGLDIFLAKYDSTGTHVWSQRFGSPIDDICNGIAVDASNNVFITGGFEQTINFGGTNMTASTGYDFYVAKFNSAGTHQWSRRASANGNEFGQGIAIDGSGNVLCTGSFTALVNFGGSNLTTAGGQDIFLVKFANADGAHTWSQRFGGTAADVGYGVTADASDNVTLTGYFSNTSSFGGTNLVAGSIDTVIASYDSSGTFRWAQKLGAPILAFGYGITSDSSANVIAAGFFQGTASGGGQSITSAGGSDIFAIKMNSNGVRSWTRSFGGSGADIAYGISRDSTGSIIITGGYANNAVFYGTTFPSAGLQDIFLLKTAP